MPMIRFQFTSFWASLRHLNSTLADMNKTLICAFLAVTSLALVLDIVALSTIGWLELGSTYAYGGGATYGLFRVCAGGYCISFEPTATWKVVAAFLISTLFVLVGAILLAALGYLGKDDHLSKAWILCVIAALFVLIAVATYGGYYANSGLPGQGSSLGYSFDLACAVGGLSIISAVLGFLMTK